MAFVDPNTPNIADFSTFVYGQGVTELNLPINSEYLLWALSHAQNVALPGTSDMPGIVYVMAVYNLGFHQLITQAQDQPGQNYFSGMRTTFGLLSFTAGPIVTSSDEATSETMITSEWMKNMTLSALGLLKTPWGRAYLEYAQMYGSNIVDVS